mgnify:CR=1 FL=1
MAANEGNSGANVFEPYRRRTQEEGVPADAEPMELIAEADAHVESARQDWENRIGTRSGVAFGGNAPTRDDLGLGPRNASEVASYCAIVHRLENRVRQVVTGVTATNDLPELLRTADYISIHAPATDETRGLFKIADDPRITATICGVSKPERVPQTLPVTPSSRAGVQSAGDRRRHAPLSVRKVRSAAAPAASTRQITVPVGASGSTAIWGRTEARRSVSSCHAAASAPARPRKRTSRHPQCAAQQATLAPAPPGTVRIAATVSVPGARGARWRATMSVTTSPTTRRAPVPFGEGAG